MALLGVRRSCTAVLAALVLVLVAAPSYAMTEEECSQQAVNPGDTCIPDGDGYALVVGSEEFDGFGAGDPGFPDGFIALFILFGLVGVGITIWKVAAARQMAREAGMDPDRATGMTLLDDNGLSATYLASSLRTAPSGASDAAAPRSTADRLAELKSLLDNGAITQAEYDGRRQAIIDSV
jgi:hypothetical protein